MATVDPNSMSNMNNMVLEFGRCGLILQLKPSMWNRDDLIFGLRFMHGLVLWISPGNLIINSHSCAGDNNN